MDLETMRKAVRSIARDGSVAQDVLASLPLADRPAIVSLERRARKAGSLAAVTPPAHSTMWYAPPRE